MRFGDFYCVQNLFNLFFLEAIYIKNIILVKMAINDFHNKKIGPTDAIYLKASGFLISNHLGQKKKKKKKD